MFLWQRATPAQVRIIFPSNRARSFITRWDGVHFHMDRVKRIWYLSPMRAAKVQASLRIRAVSPEPSLLAHRSSESRGTFRQKARSMAPLNGWACAVKMCHDGMLEDTNSLDGAHIVCKTLTALPGRKCDTQLYEKKFVTLPPPTHTWMCSCNEYVFLKISTVTAYLKIVWSQMGV